MSKELLFTGRIVGTGARGRGPELTAIGEVDGMEGGFIFVIAEKLEKQMLEKYGFRDKFEMAEKFFNGRDIEVIVK